MPIKTLLLSGCLLLLSPLAQAQTARPLTAAPDTTATTYHGYFSGNKHGKPTAPPLPTR